MSTFLPKDYSAPKADSKYTRIHDGDNIKMRILSEPLIFWEFWVNEKPIRYPFVPGELVPSAPKGARDPLAKFVWAVIIYNYSTNKVEIWSIAQKGIQKKLETWACDEDFGDPRNYDIKVSRVGKDKGNTTYDASALMKKENMEALDADILAEAKKIDLKALISGDDPFGSTSKTIQEEQDSFDPLA